MFGCLILTRKLVISMNALSALGVNRQMERYSNEPRNCPGAAGVCGVCREHGAEADVQVIKPSYKCPLCKRPNYYKSADGYRPFCSQECAVKAVSQK